jgi:hypothetical protein
MNWQTYYRSDDDEWKESVLLENMTLEEAEDWVLNCDAFEDEYKIEEAA